MINLLPDNQRVDPTSPYELFVGNKVDYKQQIPISFCDYTECKNPNRKPINTVKPRTDPCIALLPLLNAQGSYLFFDLTTRRTVVRDRWVELPMPSEIITRCENLAKAQGKALRVLPHFSRGVPVDEDNMTIETMSDTELFDQNQNPEILNDIKDETSNTPSSDDEDEQLSVIDKTNNIQEYEIEQPYNLDILNSSHDETEPEDLYGKDRSCPIFNLNIKHDRGVKLLLSHIKMLGIGLMFI